MAHTQVYLPTPWVIGGAGGGAFRDASGKVWAGFRKGLGWSGLGWCCGTGRGPVRRVGCFRRCGLVEGVLGCLVVLGSSERSWVGGWGSQVCLVDLESGWRGLGGGWGKLAWF